ncbi:NmrA-like family protein [Talaromyces stipitatus ATCC 10500]|uniref:NmrA-like family protein n=1 Tax=Talaromyces stipitatus (strain ATCC 10500 / CBS 375.48 / QM 6759 / NRRL 1006) TaxID=441959 RepID=B8MPA4_TALSN|nr:NmrA-like family protein [Talaromyces stipitatus ATCC 10500]EED14343.1 NmrA-like family protein [Talaromyces stipitatus ATCC 10500]
MTEKKIGIFPASGSLGGSTVKHLASLIPASSLILIARKPDTLAECSRQGAVVRRADYDEDSSLNRVFDGVGVLFLISYASCEHEHRSKAHRKAIDAALRSGVKHIFYSSLAFAGNLTKSSDALVMRAHLDTEAYLEELGRTNAPDFTYTIIREGLYHESFPIYTSFFHPQEVIDAVTDDNMKRRHHGGPNDRGEIHVKIPHDGSGPGVAWAKRDELGEATAKLINLYMHNPSGFPYTNSTLLLSGPKALTLNEVISILEKLIRERTNSDIRIKIKQVSVDEYASQPHVPPLSTYHGVDLSREWATAWEAIRKGECAVVTPVLKELLGREPEDFETTVRNDLSRQYAS